MDKKYKRYKDLYELFKETPLEKIFKGKLTEKKIKKIWKENIKYSKLPVVICLNKYVIGIGGLIESKNSISTDREILQRFLYTSIIQEGIFRDIFYLIKMVKKLEERWVWDFFKEFLKNKEIKKEYDSRVSKLKDKEDFKIALLIQIIYSMLNEEEIEKKFLKPFIEEANEKIIKNIKKWFEIFPEWYDAFYFGYKKDNGEKYLKCYAITKYGVIRDISFDGKEISDPVKLLAEKIEEHINEDRSFQLELEEKLKHYPKDIKLGDKIYEYIMEIPDLSEGELKEIFLKSSLLEKIFTEVVPEGEKIKEIVIKKEKNEWKEIIYHLLLLALGFELPSIKMDYNNCDVKALRNKLEEYKKAVSGAGSTEEKKEKIKEYLHSIFTSLESFLSHFVPFIISKEECKGCIENLREEKYRENIRDKIFGKDYGKKPKPLTLGDWIEKLKEIKFDKEKIKKLNEIKDHRNDFFHRGKEFDIETFKRICDTLDRVYEYIEQNFPFFILKIHQLVDDLNARKYLIAYELKGKKKWYITFENEKMYDEIDATYFYYVSSSPNPVARNPFMMPILPKIRGIFESE